MNKNYSLSFAILLFMAGLAYSADTFFHFPTFDHFRAIIKKQENPVLVTEICNNSTDDDGDGLIDCLDPDCQVLITGSAVNVTCAGAGNGAVNLNVRGGTGNYTYAWANGATTEDLTGIGAGSYTVTVTDASGCSAMQVFKISTPATLRVSSNVTDANCDGTVVGAIDLTVTGGVPPYTYLWSNGAVTGDLSNLTAGIYGVTVMDASGCSKELFFTVSNNSGSGLERYFIPLPDDQVHAVLRKFTEAKNKNIGAEMKTIISIVATENNSIIYYDHWEDGYEPDIENPVQSTTQIWGDGNAANGIPPGFSSDVVNVGDVIGLVNLISMPRNPSALKYDGRDMVASNFQLAVTRAGWAPDPGPVLSGAVEIFENKTSGMNFEVPVGENISADDMFEFTALFVMAQENLTPVLIDTDGNGTPDITQILNKGQSYLINGGVKAGTKIISLKPVQVNLITGDLGGYYETRWFSLFPVKMWDNCYYAPVGTTVNNDVANVFIYNPKSSAITVNYNTMTGTGAFTVSAKGVYRYAMPSQSGAHFYTHSESDKFCAISTIDSDKGDNDDHDWGYTLVPESYLTVSATIGWGPGNEDYSDNGSPAWVTSTKATTLYVDYDGDPSTGPKTDALGNKYNISYNLAAFESRRVFDPNDNDQTGMFLYTLDGTLIATAWGQDPATSDPGNPFLDFGTTVPPIRRINAWKEFSLVTDNNGNGQVEPGDVISFTIVLKNDGNAPIFGALVKDPLPGQVTYVANSTRLNNSLIPDNTTGTPFPLDGLGYNIPVIPVNSEYRLTFNTKVNAQPPIFSEIVNTFTALITNPCKTLTGYVIVPVVPVPASTSCSLAFTDVGGGSISAYPLNSQICVRLTDGDRNLSAYAKETVPVTLHNTTSGDTENLTLTETGDNTGVFQGCMSSSSTTGQTNQNGTLYAAGSNSLSVNYTDAVNGDQCSAIAAMFSSAAYDTKQLYLTDVLALDRVDPVATQDATTAATAALAANPGVIVIDNTSSQSTTGSSLTFSHTTGTGLNRLLLVGVVTGSTTSINSNAPTVTGVTYNGGSLTLLGSVAETGTRIRTYLYQMVNPPSGTYNVVVTTASSSPLYAGATTFAGVSQASPTGAFASNSIGTPAGELGGTTDITVNPVSSASGDLIYAVIGVDTDGSTLSITPGSGQTSAWSFSSFSTSSAGCSTKPGAPAATMSYSWSGDQQSTIAAVSIKPATLAGSNTATFTQSPAMCSHFVLPSGGAVSATAYAKVTSGTIPINPDIPAVLKSGGNTLVTLNDPVLTPLNTVPASVSYKVGSFTKSTTTGTQTITHNLGFTPKAIIMWTSGQAGENISSAYRFAQGFSDGTTSYSFSAASQDNVSTSNTSRRFAAKALTIVEWGEVLLAEANLSSWNTSTFSLNWTTNNSGQYIIHYMIIGGNDVSAKVVNWQMPASTGNIAVTGVGFQPDLVFSMHGGGITNAAPFSGSNSAFGFGAMNKAGEQMGLNFFASDNQTGSMVTNSTQRPDAVVLASGVSSGEDKLFIKGAFLSMDANGFTMNFSSVSGANQMVSLALKGVESKIGSFNKSTSTGNQTISDAGFQPAALMLASYGTSASTTVQPHVYFTQGASDGTNMVNSYVVDEDNYSLTDADGSNKTTKIFTKSNTSSANPATPDAEAGLVSMNNNGFTLNWTTNTDGIAAQILYLALNSPLSATNDYRLDWSGNLDNQVSVPAGQAIALDITNQESGVAFQVQYDSETKPSRVNLPTHTVITIDSLAVYDAAYPGGATLTSAAVGDQVYIRSTVSDPFGYADIRKLTLKITAPGGGSSNIDMLAVDSSACSKTFEYGWNIPQNAGDFDLRVIAFEGYENAVFDTVNITIKVNPEDPNPPCLLSFTDGGQEVNNVEEGSPVCVELVDADKNQDVHSPDIVVVQVISSTGDKEHVLLVETGDSTGVFAGCVNSSATTGQAVGNGVLYATAGGVLSVAFISPGATNPCSASATVSAEAPFTKVLYLTEPGQGLDRIDPVATADLTTATAAVSATPATFTQIIPMCSNLDLPTGGILRVTTFITATSGSIPVNPNISAVLKHGTTTFATLTNPVYNSSAGTLSWTQTLGSNYSLPAGQKVSLVITRNDSGYNFNIQYDSQTKPSRIELPTTTVIEIEDMALYDAPYPGGQPVTGAVNGQALYIRTTVSDPFGAYDITGLDLKITPPSGPVFTANLTDADTVATTACGKIYEYAWTPGILQGKYHFSAVAHEGYESVADTLDLEIEITFNDLGTDCNIELTDNAFTAVDSYNANQQVCMKVTDIDENEDSLAVETLVVLLAGSSNDKETVTLTETGANTGMFTGCINASATVSGSTENGQLYAAAGDFIQLNYTDKDDNSDGCFDQVLVKSLVPAVSVLKKLIQPADGIALVGESLQFAITIFNAGPTTLTTLTLTDNFNNGCMSYASASDSPNSTGAGLLTWNNVGPLAPGASKTILVNFVAAGACDPAVNTVTVSGTDQNGTPVTDGPATAAVKITEPGLSLNKIVVDPVSGPVLKGDTVTYHIVLTNNGSTAITSLPMSDEYSDFCLQYLNASISPDAISGGTAFWANLGPLAPGASLTVSMQFRVSESCGTVPNTADVSFAVDENGDAVPPVFDIESIVVQSPPVAVDDVETTLVNTPVTIPVSANDWDPNFDLDIHSVQTIGVLQPSHGSVSVNTATGEITYTPVNGFTGTDIFEYIICDLTNLCDTAKVFVTILPNNPPVANDDYTGTLVNTPVQIDVLVNDYDPDDNIVNSTVSTTGLQPPAHGTVTSIDAATGEITYTPTAGYTGTDQFEYRVCDATGLCDTATVYILIRPCTVTAGQNNITGTVFEDVNANGVYDPADLGKSGVDVLIYRDNNQNGMLDAGDTQATSLVSDANGNYVYSPNLGGVPQTVTASVAAASDDAEENTSTGGVTVSSPDLEMVTDGTALQTVGIRFTNLAIPQGATITDARIEFYADLSESGTTNLTFYGQKADNATTFTTATSNISSRAKTTAFVAWNSVPSWTDNGTYQTPNLASIVKEIVDRPAWASGNSMAFVVTGSGNRRSESFEGGGGPVPKLIVTYTTGTWPVKFVIRIDQNDLPGNALMTTDTLETVDFTGAGQSDCGNDFGFVIPAGLRLSVVSTDVTCGNYSDGTANLTVTGGIAPYQFNWSNGATTEDLIGLPGGGYLVTVTDALGNSAVSGAWIQAPVPISLTILPTNITCAGNDGKVDLLVSGGTYPFTYAWSNGATTQDISGLSVTGAYTVTVTDARGCSAGASTVVTGPTNFTDAGYINGDESACGTFNPAVILSSGSPSGGNGTATFYQWQFSTNGGTTWIDISGATGATYDPPSISQTTLYRRGARSYTCVPWIYSAVVTKLVSANVTDGGSIGSDETYCGSYNPALITSSAAASGGSGNAIIYQWQQSTDGGTTWTNITGATGTTYDPPVISQTTRYRRAARRSPCEIWVNSNVVVKKVVVSFSNGGVIGSDEAYCNNYDPALITEVTPPSGGADGTPVYQWESRQSDGAGGWLSWENISGATAASYDPPNINVSTQYRRRINTPPCTDWKYSNTVSKSFYSDLGTAGTIAGNESNCGPFQPGIISNVTDAGGGSGGNIDYRWQERTATGNWQTINGATGLTYTPPFISETMRYRRQARNTVCSGWYSSNEIVKEVVTNFNDGGVMTGSETTCGGNYDAVAISEVTAPVGGNGNSVSYSWEYRQSNGAGGWTAWQTVAGATGISYDPGIISMTTQYRRLTRRSPCLNWVYSNVITKSAGASTEANPDTISVCPGAFHIDNVKFNDVIPSNPVFNALSLPVKGTLTMENSGLFTYTPNGAACGPDQFTYRVCNINGDCCDTTTVLINIGDAIPPVLQNLPADITITCADKVPSPPLVFGLDACPGIFISMQEISTQVNAEACPNYQITRTWVATDLCGNDATGSQVITVEDTEAPEIYRIYTLGNGKKVVAGVSRDVSHLWKTVSFPVQFASTPVVFSQVVTSHESSPVIARQKDISSSIFSLRLQEEEAGNGIHQPEDVAWLAIEPGAFSDLFQFEANTVANVTSTWKQFSFSQNYTFEPAFIASVQTFNQPDPVTVRYNNVTPATVQVILQEETSLDAEVVHGNEILGFLNLSNGADFVDGNGNAFGETGTLTVDQNWKTINLGHTYNNPVVIMGGVSWVNSDEVTIRVRNVTASSFEVRLEEWAFLDVNHPGEKISYVVVEGSIPAEVGVYCQNQGYDLVTGVDLVAQENCDNNVVVNLEEVSGWAGSGFGYTRTWTAADDCGNMTEFTKLDTCPTVAFKLKVFLRGALVPNVFDTLMRDDLRALNYLPLTEPYTGMSGFVHKGGGGGEVVADPALFQVTGHDAIVDWVFIELRSTTDSTHVIATQSALVQRDGDVVNVSGQPVIYFRDLVQESYFVTLRHRNHLGVMTKHAPMLSSRDVKLIDMTRADMETYGDLPQFVSSTGRRYLWPGDLNGDRKALYQGPATDVFSLFSKVLVNNENTDYLANYILKGYNREDYNLDGRTIYQGPGNDRALLLLYTTMSHPGNTAFLANFAVTEKLP